MNIEYKLQGEYKLCVSRPDGSVIETPWFHNTILDQGLDRLGQTLNQTVIGYAQVGTGNTPPATGQTSLQSFLAGSQTLTSNPGSYVNSGSPNYTTTKTWTLQFAQGAVVGTISEVGVGWANTAGNNLFSRELIRDGGGSPTTLSLSAIDQLTVFYKLTITPSIVDHTGSVILDSISYNYTSRLLRADFFAVGVTATLGQNIAAWVATDCLTFASGAGLAAITANFPTGSAIPSGDPTSNTITAYINGTYYLDQTLFWNTGRGNGSGGLQAILLANTSTAMYQQVVFSAPIPKDNTKTLSLTFRVSWNRI